MEPRSDSGTLDSESEGPVKLQPPNDYVPCFNAGVWLAVLMSLIQICAFPLQNQIEGMYRAWDFEGLYRNHYMFHVTPAFVAGALWMHQIWTRGTPIHFTIGKLYFCFYPIIIYGVVLLFTVPTYAEGVPFAVPLTAITLFWCIVTYLVSGYYTFSAAKSRWGHKFWITRHIAVHTFVGWQRLANGILRSRMRDDLLTALVIGHAVGLSLAVLSGELLVMNLKKQKLAEQPDEAI